ncbi:MAG: YegS/Rv2252/BmrU family lipid kinase [Lachnospiraceae bacterium]|nr:YegS/Rv2252/BmrU family lipid kinase [Lachnospiraceae bacterium]MDY5741612.1 YegS/Rv2252/BmrU family lipid kinase [Lachnospiraceae bacterium]
MKRLLFIYNPRAGKGMIHGRVSGLVNVFIDHGYLPTVYPTQKRGDAIHRLEEWAGDYDAIVCAGGDGTLDEVVEGLLHSGRDIPIGYIPTGSTNDFAGSLGIPKDIMKSAAVAVSEHTLRCDIGRLHNGNHFVYVAAFGALTEVSYETDQTWKNIFGHAAYIFEAIKRLGDIKTYRIRVETDDAVIEDEFIYGMVTNSESVGGFKGVVGADIGLSDGVFEITLVKKLQSVLDIPPVLTELGKPESVGDKYYYRFKASRIKFISRDGDIAWTLDGEYGGAFRELEIVNEHQAVSFRVTEKTARQAMEAASGIEETASQSADTGSQTEV